MRTRVVVGRNLERFPFPWRQDSRTAEASLLAVAATLGTLPGFGRFDLALASTTERRAFVERGLLRESYAFSSAAALYQSGDEPLFCVVNDDDHVDILAELPGARIDETSTLALSVADAFEARERVAFTPDFGYLAAEPERCGDMIRVSALLHLAGLHAAGLIDRTVKAALESDLEVTGRYSGHESSMADLYEFVPARTRLGGGKKTMEGFSRAISEITRAEREVRKRLLSKNRDGVEDMVFRAYGTLRYARTMDFDEAVDAAFRLRLGHYLGIVGGLQPGDFTDFLCSLQPAGLLYYHMKGETEADGKARARILRDAASRIRIEGA
ncbi:MAG: hypothetical protein NT080_13800 [Spirochaetes bacterium]|nr:hypothetical protein [Spirochaetota bacterium]